MAKEKKKGSWVGPTCMLGGAILWVIGLFKYASDDPEGAGRVARAFKPRTKVVTRHEGLLSSWTTVRYE